MAPLPYDRVAGSLFGAALGDALGAQTEFVRSDRAIRAKWPPNGPDEPATGRGGVYLVTDDTQMMLAVGRALMAVHDLDTIPAVQEQLPAALRAAFLEWYHDPQNNRAPGNTCMSSCRGHDREPDPARWTYSSIVGSKGCGGNMRVQPVGLLDPERFDVEDRAGIAQLQSAVTHGHPTALAASELTAEAIHLLATGTAPQDVPAALRARADSQRRTYHWRWLGDLWERSQDPHVEAFMGRGWDEVIGVLDRLDRALEAQDRETDPCSLTGDAWIAEEALATGLLCFLLYPDDPRAALQRAVITRGDSDSIACLTGAFAGAYHGLSAWAPAWLDRIEYRDELETLARTLSAR